jgi:S-adenosylmethionine decarboxylase
VLLDLWGARHLDDADHIERAMRRAVDVSGATLLHIHLHRFGDGGGVTGVAVLAESHITVHTWPERGFAAFDVFLCGGCRPDLAADALRNALEPERTEMTVERRGVVG